METAVNYYNHINQLLCYIENNLSHNLDVKFITGLGHISHAQLYRDFYSATGHSVKEYIRKRRLSNALAMIKLSDKTIVDIAYECGFSSQSALNRAVKQAVNMTPIEYRTSEVHYFFSPFNDRAAQKIIVSTEIMPATCCIKFYHSCLLGIENQATKRFFDIVPSFNGRLFGRNGKQVGTMFCYELYITDYEAILGTLKTSDFVYSGFKPQYQSLFATSITENDESKINTAWDFLYSDWLPESMFECTELPYFEEYINKNGEINKLQLYLPIQKSNRLDEIKLERNPRLCFVTARSTGYNAERNASKTVIDYLEKQYPYVIIPSKEFYVKKIVDGYICGVKLGHEPKISEEHKVAAFTTDECDYLVMHTETIGIYEKYCDKLLNFAYNNGIRIDVEGIFAVYDATKGYDRPKLRMYAPVTRI